jgi:hypothetical protein
MDVRATDETGAETPVPVRPLDVDGVRATTIGTALWAVAFVVLLPFQSALREDDRTWWFGVCAVGFLLGLAGIAYTVRRRAVIRRVRG